MRQVTGQTLAKKGSEVEDEKYKLRSRIRNRTIWESRVESPAHDPGLQTPDSKRREENGMKEEQSSPEPWIKAVGRLGDRTPCLSERKKRRKENVEEIHEPDAP
ncbi:hypothetical protein M1O51_02690 [Dehalococcoidia bacterium]|nr:hypothetical protein [Dehalococcoidia bacterium]